MKGRKGSIRGTEEDQSGHKEIRRRLSRLGGRKSFVTRAEAPFTLPMGEERTRLAANRWHDSRVQFRAYKGRLSPFRPRRDDHGHRRTEALARADRRGTRTSRSPRIRLVVEGRGLELRSCPRGPRASIPSLTPTSRLRDQARRAPEHLDSPAARGRRGRPGRGPRPMRGIRESPSDWRIGSRMWTGR